MCKNLPHERYYWYTEIVLLGWTWSLFDGTQTLQKLARNLQGAASSPSRSQTSQEQAAALDPIPAWCQRHREALSLHPSRCRHRASLSLPQHSRGTRKLLSVPSFPEHPRARWNLTEREGGTIPSNSSVLLQVTPARPASSGCDTALPCRALPAIARDGSGAGRGCSSPACHTFQHSHGE